MNNKFKIVSFKADVVSLVPTEITDAYDFDLGFDVGFSEDELKSFIVKFKVKISAAVGYTLSVEYTALFETEEQITDGFKNSNFATVDAPAIAYPFLRSFISTLTINAGYDPVLIPNVDFQFLLQKSMK
ncbi:MAG: protein-export chaperone SecB [Methylococcaceae bacterium]